MQGGNEYENNDDVNDANVYVKKCDPVFNSFVAYLNAQRPGKFLGFFCILRFWFQDRKSACKKTTKHHNLKVIEFQLG